MIFGVVADIHGNFEAMHAAMARHPDVPFWLCVGDLASRAGAYPEPIAPLYWIKGNNDNFDAIESYVNGTLHTPNLHYIPNGTAELDRFDKWQSHVICELGHPQVAASTH